jgi:hypothetical protein
VFSKEPEAPAARTRSAARTMLRDHWNLQQNSVNAMPLYIKLSGP